MTRSKNKLREELRALIRRTGLRCTMARVTVLETLHQSRAPLSHAELSDQLTGEGFDKATIYRNLVELAEAGIVSRVELGDHTWRFEFQHDGEAGSAEHPHFVCVDCGAVTCLPQESIDSLTGSARLPAVVARVTQVLLKGHCDRCV